MNDHKKLKLFFALNCLASGIIITPLFFLVKNIQVIAASPSPDMFVDHMTAVAVGIIIGKPLMKFTRLRLRELNAKLQTDTKSGFLKKTASIITCAAFSVLIYTLVSTKNEAKDLASGYSAQSLPQSKVDIKKAVVYKPSFKEHPLASHHNAYSMWDTCTFVLYKADNTSGGTKMFNSVPTCIARFKEYFQKYACRNNLDIKGVKQTIKSGQLNFGKKLNYQRKPAADYFILVSAECVEE